jgi:RNA methyltransferase, TrmH family
MTSKAKLKYINSLQIKKIRKQSQEFLVEGAKSVLELLNSDFEITSLYLTDNFVQNYFQILKSKNTNYEIVKEGDLSRMGTYTSNNAAIAIAKMKENKPLYLSSDEFILILDEVKDPGNLGTIIRIADWYGIEKIICSEDTAELYNPKVIASSMGSFTRIELYYCDLLSYMAKVKGSNVYAAVIDGKDVHKVDFSKKGYVLMGNESSGIHKDLYPFVTDKISIPGKGKAESLNVAVATAVICDVIMNKS